MDENVIIPEEILDAVFLQIPAIETDNNTSSKPQFEYGTKKYLLEFLEENKKNYPYPLIFMETPVKSTGNSNIREFELRLVLATKTKSEFSTRKRSQTTIKKRLKPLLEYVIYSLQSANTTRIVKKNNDDTERDTFSIHYNYGNAEETENEFPAIWDAIEYNCTLEIKRGWLQNINFNTYETQ